MKRTHKNISHVNINFFPIALVVMAALSGLMTTGCGDDRAGCGWELDNGKEYYTCRDDDGDIDRRSPAGENTCVLSHTYLDDDGTRIFVCLDGEEFTMEGQDGEDGSDGVNGSDGIDGQGCVLSQVGDTCTLTCPNGSTTFWCGSAPPGTCTPSTEVCNGRDDDCDKQIDEGGVCDGTGCTPTAEICDGVDNDCDGQIDEGLNCGGTTTGSWQVLAMEVRPSDQTLTCDGTPIVPSTNCNGTVGFNREWIEERTIAVYNGTFTTLSLLGGKWLPRVLLPGAVGRLLRC